MEPLNEIIAEKKKVTHGSNGYYDIRLRKRSTDSLLIEVGLSVFFMYIPNGSDQNIKWTQREKYFFEAEWLRQLPASWDRQDYWTYRGFKVSIAFVCTIGQQVNNTLWQANVMKLKDRTAFRTSAVCLNCYGAYDAKFDSNDDVEKPGGRKQTAMIHEFGHMIGLPDEYESGSTHVDDKDSIMNVGAIVRSRHLTHFIDWAKPHINNIPNAPEKIFTSMNTLLTLREAKSSDAEIAALRSWRDGGGPQEGIHFVIRDRATKKQIPIPEIPLDRFETLEVEFSSIEGSDGEIIIWEPKSREALEMLFLE